MASQNEIEMAAVQEFLKARGWTIPFATVEHDGLYLQARRVSISEPLSGRPLRTLGPEDLRRA